MHRHVQRFGLIAIALVALACGSNKTDDDEYSEVPEPRVDAAADTSAGGSSGHGGSAGTGGSVGGSSGTAGKDAGAGGAEMDGGAGTAGSSGGTAGSAGTAGAAGGVSCSDIDTEPDDSQTTAQAIADTSDCDASGGTVPGTLEGGSDEDWFSLNMDDSPTCEVDPSFEVTVEGDVEVCVYYRCASGDAELQCEGGGYPGTSPEGTVGCCTNSKAMSNTLNCTGTLTDSAQVWLRARSPGNDKCLQYEIKYKF